MGRVNKKNVKNGCTNPRCAIDYNVISVFVNNNSNIILSCVYDSRNYIHNVYNICLYNNVIKYNYYIQSKNSHTWHLHLWTCADKHMGAKKKKPYAVL